MTTADHLSFFLFLLCNQSTKLQNFIPKWLRFEAIIKDWLLPIDSTIFISFSFGSPKIFYPNFVVFVFFVINKSYKDNVGIPQTVEACC